jgi:hypothetical protein
MMLRSFVKQGLGDRLGQFGLADAGGAQKQEGAYGAGGVPDAGAGAQMASLTFASRLVLALSDAPVQYLVQDAAAFPPLALHKAAYRIPVQRATMRAFSSSVTRSRSRAPRLFSSEAFFKRLNASFWTAAASIAQLGGPAQIIAPLCLFKLGVCPFNFFP